MTVRIKFAKYGNLRYLSHLDVMRFFQKAIRRAGIDVSYSEGFHPHQLMSFAAPLGVGQTSEGEYFDLQLDSMVSTGDVFERLQNEMPEGFCILNVALMPETPPQTRKESLMALVCSSDYILIRENKDDHTLTNDEFLSRFSSFVKRVEIKAVKTTKVGDTELNIAPFIYGYEGNVKPTAFCEAKEDQLCIYLLLSAGNENHIRPELLMKAFYEAYDLPYDPYEWSVHRLEAYTEKDGVRLPIVKLHAE